MNIFARAWRTFTLRFDVLLLLAFCNQLILGGVTPLIHRVDPTSIDAVLSEMLDRPEALFTIMQQHWIYGIFALITLILDTWLSTAAISCLLQPKESMRTHMRISTRFFWVALITNLALTILTIAGSIAFLLPGLIITVYGMFATPLLVVNMNASPLKAITSSMALVRGAFWKCAALYATILLGVWSLAGIWDSLTASVSHYAGADLIVATVMQLIGCFGTLVIASYGLQRIEETKASTPKIA